jgi:hypothetical protein
LAPVFPCRWAIHRPGSPERPPLSCLPE